MRTFFHPPPKPCRCGSGLARRELVDARGIFCAFVCAACETAKRAEFDPRIFSLPTYPSDEVVDEEDPR